ncbi:TetR/AcrR family transcriptional regulator [Geodermatophilus sp. CPCC 206100]|uniref:TetR/AcrR family transcriptional regulator n=1 Tax=Geodermatophilus sp. CPCC 206100 TaxID=3020054 RepID=UPI003AFFA9FA
MTSPCPDHRARRRAQTHRRIYCTAMELFQERGFEGVTVGQIAAAAQVSVPTFYDHFPSKEHVVLPMPERGDLERVLAAQDDGLTLAERMRRAILAWLGSFRGQEREELLDRWRIVVRTPGLRTRAATFERATAEMIVGLVQNEPRPAVAAEIVVTASLSAYTQILVRWAEGDGQRPLEDVAAEVLAALHEL